MRTALAVVIVVDAYVLIYYRLLVRHYYEEAHGIKEGTFGALFSFPPYAGLPEPGRKYARRYWVAAAVLTVCVLVLATITDLSGLPR